MEVGYGVWHWRNSEVGEWPSWLWCGSKMHNCDQYVYVLHWEEAQSSLKGITSRISRLLFVNQQSKFAPPPRLKGRTLVVPHAYDPAPGRNIFMDSRTSHLFCVLLLAGGYTPLPKGRCLETSRPQQNKKIQAEGRSLQIQTPPHTASGS